MLHPSRMDDGFVADGKCKIDNLQELGDAGARKAMCDTIGATINPVSCKEALALYVLLPAPCIYRVSITTFPSLVLDIRLHRVGVTC